MALPESSLQMLNCAAVALEGLGHASKKVP